MALKSFASCLIIATFAAGCSLTPEYVRPDVPVPEKFTARSGAHVPNIDPQWWRAFRNRTLNRLVAEARNSGFVKASIDRANIPGSEVAPAPTR